MHHNPGPMTFPTQICHLGRIYYYFLTFPHSHIVRDGLFA